MNQRIALGLTLLAGVVIGATAINGLHAQTKPKAYIVTETELIDAAALAVYTPQAQAAVKAAGGVPGIVASGKIVALVGEPPKRFGVSEWESLEKAQAFRNSAAYKDLAPQRDKAVKAIRSYAVEVR